MQPGFFPQQELRNCFQLAAAEQLRGCCSPIVVWKKYHNRGQFWGSAPKFGVSSEESLRIKTILRRQSHKPNFSLHEKTTAVNISVKRFHFLHTTATILLKSSHFRRPHQLELFGQFSIIRTKFHEITSFTAISCSCTQNDALVSQIAQLSCILLRRSFYSVKFGFGEEINFDRPTACKLRMIISQKQYSRQVFALQ